MKHLLIALTFLTTVHTTVDACTIKLLKTKPDAKTHYLENGKTFSKTMVERLKDQCRFDVRVMTAQENHDFKVKRLEKRLAKLKSKEI